MNINDIKNKYVLVCKRGGQNDINEEISNELAGFLLEKGIAKFKSGKLQGVEQTNYIWIE